MRRTEPLSSVSNRCTSLKACISENRMARTMGKKAMMVSMLFSSKFNILQLLGFQLLYQEYNQVSVILLASMIRVSSWQYASYLANSISNSSLFISFFSGFSIIASLSSAVERSLNLPYSCETSSVSSCLSSYSCLTFSKVELMMSVLRLS